MVAMIESTFFAAQDQAKLFQGWTSPRITEEDYFTRSAAGKLSSIGRFQLVDILAVWWNSIRMTHV